MGRKARKKVVLEKKGNHIRPFLEERGVMEGYLGEKRGLSGNEKVRLGENPIAKKKMDRLEKMGQKRGKIGQIKP